ncbi:MAG: hypothetical protein Q9178_001178 [Gyalolechia marmorata]
MEDAPPDLSAPSTAGHQPPQAIRMSSSTGTNFEQDVSGDAQMLLQRMAQDASSQAEETATTPGHPQDGESALNTINDHALVNGHVLPLSNAGASQTANGIGIEDMVESGVLPDPIGAEDLYPSYHDFDHADLPNGSLNLTQANIQALGDHPTLETATSLLDVESQPPRVSAFAKLEFDDGEFYMNTYSVELGRDVRAARQASENHVQAVRRASGSSGKPSSSSGDASRSSSKKIRRENRRRLASSIVSESGGVMAVDRSDAQPSKQRRSKSSKSATSSSQQLSRKSSLNFPDLQTDYQSLALASLSDPLPSPESCPLVPIHPPTLTDGISTSHKSISRKHVKIAFNFERHLFELTVMGRNGAFVDEEWYPAGDTQPLRSGSLIQIGGVGIRFLLPDVALGETGANRNVNSDPASFELATGNGASGDTGDSSDGESDEQDDDQNESRDDSDEDKSDETNESDDENKSGYISEEETRGRPREPKPTLANRPVRNRRPVKGKEPMKTKTPPKAKRPEKVKLKLKPRKEPTPEPVAPPPKRKGPGRPPKNGIISKRAQAELARQAREAAKGGGKGEPDTKPGRGKGKSVPTSADTKQEENNLQPNGKRKYKKRKSKADTEGEQQQVIRESTEHTESLPPEQNAAPAPPPKPPKPVKPPKPPRSPSPVFDEATLTAEQLAKPQSSYVVLIHEALSNSKTGQMSLPQIYRAIERKYPFYKLRVQTTGWQSSVRHNLSQHPAFCKIERDGKGWMWGLVPDVSIEKEKKRRLTPPPMPVQGYYPAPQMMQQPSYSYPMPYPPYAVYPGMSTGQRPPYPPPPHFTPRPTASSLPPALANAVDTSSTYQSPYATGPMPQAAESSQLSHQPPDADGKQSAPAAASAKPQDTVTNNNPAQPPVSNPPNSNQLSSLSPPSPYAPTQLPIPRLQHLLSQQTPDVSHVVQKFKTYLLESMADNRSAESLIDSAIHRVLSPNSPPLNNLSSEKGSENENGFGGKDDPHEKAITGILQGMLDNLRKKHSEGGAGAGSGSGGGGAMAGGERAGNRDTMFFRILEKVNEKNDGSLPLPSQQSLPIPRAVAGAGAVGGKEEEEVGVMQRVDEGVGGEHGNERGGKVNGTTAVVDDDDKAGGEEVSHRVDTRMNNTMEEEGPRGIKRLINDGDDDLDERKEEGAGAAASSSMAMDQGPREAKRVAI